jgi:hypothetical protein
MTWGKYYWPTGLIIVSLLFLPAELYALTTNVKNTLSWYCWSELDVQRALDLNMHSLAWYLSFAAWVVFTVVITLHIWFMSVL